MFCMLTVITFFTLYSQANISDFDTVFIWGNVFVLRFFVSLFEMVFFIPYSVKRHGLALH